jgi:hypothetical protein
MTDPRYPHHVAPPIPSVYSSAGATAMYQMNQQELDRAAYALAKDFLLHSGAHKGVKSELLEKYLHLSTPWPDTIADLYERMLELAQAGNMNAGVIGGSIGGVGNLGTVLCGFEPSQVLEKYSSGWEDLLDDIVTQLKPRGSVPRTPRSIWPWYCRSVLSGARLLSRFSPAEDFYGWVDFFDEDERARPALSLLAEEIEGIGFALACDFLKELGYENFSKPDVHVKEIFWAIGLSPFGTSDYEVFRAVARVARNADVTPYNLDKLFWLIGSGYFYDDPHIGNNGQIGSRKKQFIEVAQVELKPKRRGEAPHVT